MVEFRMFILVSEPFELVAGVLKDVPWRTLLSNDVIFISIVIVKLLLSEFTSLSK